MHKLKIRSALAPKRLLAFALAMPRWMQSQNLQRVCECVLGRVTHLHRAAQAASPVPRHKVCTVIPLLRIIST